MAHNEHTVISPIEEIIDEARNGRMFILVDEEDRENEGDLVIPGQMATPDAINFMAKYGRGLICLSITRQRADELGLEPMTRNNRTRHETAFTVSIEAREGVSTGISASDRSRTISVAIDGMRGADDIVSPGHVFPLVAQPGGVLTRAGHTEAAVDVSRLAGLNPSGVICEIMNEDGTMARLDDLAGFAQTHKLKIGTIRDLIAFRRKHDRMTRKTVETSFEHDGASGWTAMTFFNQATEKETVALVFGNVTPDKPTLVRMHTLSLFNDVIGADGPRRAHLAKAMKAIEKEGCGVVVIINQVNATKIGDAVRQHADQRGTSKSQETSDLRDYGGGALVLAELGVHDMILLTDSVSSPVGLDAFGLSIIEYRGLSNFSEH